MSSRYFCDICGDEIDKPQTKFLFDHGRIKVEIMRAIDGTWNGGHACWSCVKAAMGDSDE